MKVSLRMYCYPLLNIKITINDMTIVDLLSMPDASDIHFDIPKCKLTFESDSSISGINLGEI